MTNRQRLELRQIELRGRINELNAAEELTDEQRTELRSATSEYIDNDVKLAAEIATEGADAGEQRERQQLEERADMGNFLSAAIEERAIPADSVEHDLQQAHELTRHQFPVTMLEERAIATIEAGATDTALTDFPGGAQNIIPRLFPRSIAAFLGVGMPMVAAGQANYPVLATGATVAAPAQNAAAADSTGEFQVYSMQPERLQTDFLYNVEQAALLPQIGPAFQRELRDALASKLDDQVINKTTDGLIHSLTQPGDADQRATYADYRKLVTESVDGKVSDEPAQVRIVLGTDTYADAETMYKSTESDETAFEAIRRISGGVRISSLIPPVASNDQMAIAARSVGRGIHAVAPVWRGVDILVDRITNRDEGQVKVSGLMLYSFKLLRQEGFRLVDLQIAG